MATINPSQDYDIIHTLTYPGASGSGNIRLHRGSFSAISGTVYYRAGTSGSWTSLSVSGLDTTFPISNTTMQIAHDWNKSGNNYMTPSFFSDVGVKEIKISQKAVLSGVVGDYFMYNYAAYCYSITSLDIPDTSSLTSVGSDFMHDYANGCTSLTSLGLPKAGWFYSHNVDWSVPSGRLGYLKGVVKDPNDLADWKYLASASGRTLYTNYIQDPDNVISLPSEANFMTFFNQYL